MEERAASCSESDSANAVHQLEHLPLLFDTHGACKLFGCSRRAWTRFVQRYSIPRFPLPGQRAWYHRDQLIAAVQQAVEL